MSRYLVDQFQDILGVNCTLSEIWDGCEMKVSLPDGSCFAVMEDEQIVFYEAQYGVTVSLQSRYPALYSPKRYLILCVDGLYAESEAYRFDIY